MGELGFDSGLAYSRVCALSFCVEEGETWMLDRKGRSDKVKDLGNAFSNAFTLKAIGGKDDGRRAKHAEVTRRVPAGREAQFLS